MIITQTPLRVSFFGGGTDFPDFFRRYGGCTLSTAIDKYVYCIIKERFDDKIYVNWSEKEIVDSVDDIKHELVREAMKKVGVYKGVEVSFLSDIPSEGSGLGSSSSVCVGVLNALYHYIGYTPTAEQLAREACEIEVGILGKPIGYQDQYIAAYGGLKLIKFMRRGWPKVEKLELDKRLIEDFDTQLMLFFSGRTRKSGEILAEQKSNISHKTLTLRQLAGKTLKARMFLERGEWEGLGRLLNEAWQLKKSLASKISDSVIDSLYEKAKDAGARGGKITGAGGGGFLLLFVPGKSRGEVRKVLDGLREMPFRFERDGSKVIFNIRRY